MTPKKPKNPVGFCDSERPRGRSHITNLGEVWDKPGLAEETAALGERLRRASEQGQVRTLQDFFGKFYRGTKTEPQPENIILLPTPDTEN